MFTLIYILVITLLYLLTCPCALSYHVKEGAAKKHNPV